MNVTVNEIKQLFNGRQHLEPDAPTPLYHQLYTILKRSIIDGTMVCGSRVPTELRLAELFDVSRITAKRAIDELASENLVKRQAGKGTHVIYEYKLQPIKPPLLSVMQGIDSEELRQTDAKVLLLDQQQPPAAMRSEFELPAGETILRMIRVRSSNRKAFAYYSSWTKGITSKIEAKAFEGTPRLEVFLDLGLEVSYINQTMTATTATPEVASTLAVEPGSPVLSVIRRAFDINEKLVDYLNVLYHPDHFEFQYRMDLTLQEKPKKKKRLSITS
ncbi:MAG: GntR family transcriptional regulator [Patiriisocius sp.]